MKRLNYRALQKLDTVIHERDFKRTLQKLCIT